MQYCRLKHPSIACALAVVLLASCQFSSPKKQHHTLANQPKNTLPPNNHPDRREADPELLALLSPDYKIDQIAFSKNHEGKENAVLLLASKADSFAARTLMILQRTAPGKWAIHDSNNHLAGPKWIGSTLPVFDSEDLSIHGDTVQFSQHCGGPPGNFDYLITKEHGEWLLNTLETFEFGAGAQRLMNYTVGKNRVVVTITNTMDEQLPEEKCPFAFRENRPLKFKDIYPDLLIKEILEQQAASTANCNF